MKNYRCFLFAWNGIPNGGCGDLIMCCKSLEDGVNAAQKIWLEYEQVHLMRCDGAKIIIMDESGRTSIDKFQPAGNA